MFTKMVALAVIAAVVACPLWCSNGICCSAQCRAEKSQLERCQLERCQLERCQLERCRVDQQSPNLVCSDRDTYGCDSSPCDEDGDPGPCGCPQKLPCQGVCGGAVFEKNVELDDVSASAFVPLLNTEISLTPQLTERQAFDVRYRGHGHGGNFGRFLCTLHSLLLC